MSLLRIAAGRRFLFITGKGGVGKTTVTAALAVTLAERGQRVLCATAHVQDRMSGLLGCDAITEQVREVWPNIWAVNIQPRAALAEYGAMVLHFKALYSAVFDNKMVNSFLRATPGLYDWAVLGKAWFHATETLSDGRSRFDVVLFDAPSTGHGLDMLQGPKVIVDVAPSGLLRREASKAWDMFSDPEKFGVVVVTLPEEMPVTETLQLLDALQGDLGLAVVQVVVNGIIPTMFTPEEREALVGITDWDLSNEADRVVQACHRRADREQVQQDSLMRLGKHVTSCPMTYLPYRFGGVGDPEALRVIASRLL